MMHPNLLPAMRQRGATLIVAMIMLILMTMIAIVSINVSTGNFKIITNAQYQAEATSAAQAALNQVFSKGTNLSEPDTSPTSLAVVINGSTYTVSLSKPCLRSSLDVKNMALSDPDIWKCTDSAAYVPGMPAGTLCSNTVWQVEADVNDSLYSKAKVHLTEGAALRMDKITADLIKSNGTNVCS